MTKCPYVLPHPWNLDFPHTMLRAKAIKHKAGQVGAGERLLASTDVHGQFAGIPVVVQIVNAVNKTRPMRKALDATLERVGYRLLDGTYGVKTATHPIAIKIGKPVFKAMAKGEPDFISSDCALAGHHIAQGMQQNQHAAAKLAHPLSLVRMAYGLE